MTDRELMQMALDALDWKLTTLLKKSWENHHIHEVIQILRDRLAQPEPVHAIDTSEERVQVSDKHRQKWVGLTDEEVQDAGRYSYCRGGTSEKLYHIMWNSQPSASVGWCREELIAFAKTIESIIRDKNT
jgi:hypothetical protein